MYRYFSKVRNAPTPVQAQRTYLASTTLDRLGCIQTMEGVKHNPNPYMIPACSSFAFPLPIRISMMRIFSPSGCYWVCSRPSPIFLSRMGGNHHQAPNPVSPKQQTTNPETQDAKFKTRNTETRNAKILNPKPSKPQHPQ